jgi:hypothetical protein
MTQPRQTYVLKPRPPVRALAIASVLAVVGAVLIVLSNAAGHPAWVLIPEALLLAAAVALAVAALLATRRLTTTAGLDESGIELSRGGRTTTLAWSEITAVELAPHHILLRSGADVAAAVPNPRGASDPGVREFLDAVRRSLDDNRGYGSLAG